MYLSITKQQNHINTQEYKKMQIQKQTSNYCNQIIQKIDPNKDNLSIILMEAIEEAFLYLIHSEYDILSILKKNGITQKNIQFNIKKFSAIIDNEFGLGSKLIKIKIIEQIHRKTQNFSFIPKKHNLFFEEYLIALFSK